MYANNQLLFPYTAIPLLRDVRGPKWAALIDTVLSGAETSDETLAFMLMTVRLNNCMACETDSYRAMRGCQSCAVQTLRRYKGTDEELMQAYQDALVEVRAHRGTLATGLPEVMNSASSR